MQGYNVGDYPSRLFETILRRLSHPRVSLLSHRLFILCLLYFSFWALPGCMGTMSHYGQIEASLRKGNPEQADHLLAAKEEAYGSTDRLLYLMERGMTLHLAGHYAESNTVLEEADHLVDELYTRRLRNEALSMFVNDTTRPFRGDPYEQVMVNVIKAMNYTLLGKLNESLVEARKIDHRLNVIGDQVEGSAYHDDPFARYLTGILYEATGDFNNAFIAYQKAYQAYQDARSWLHIPVPKGLQASLLRLTRKLHLNAEYAEYQRLFPDIVVEAMPSEGQAHVVVLGLFGRAPRLADQFLDVPISAQALGLVLQTKRVIGRNESKARGVEPLLYGLQGQVIRVALPTLLPGESQIAYGTLHVTGGEISSEYRTELVHNMTATAQKNLDDRYPEVMVRTVARVAAKMATAEGIGIGAGAAAGGKDKDTGQTVRLIVSALARIFAIATEEADKRSWRTLPNYIQEARLTLQPGDYVLRFEPRDHQGRLLGSVNEQHVSLLPGETYFLTTYSPF